MFPIHLNLNGHIFPFYEGAYFAISFLIGYSICLRSIRKTNLGKDFFTNLFLVCIAAAVLGGRIFHIVFWNPWYYLRDPVKVLFIREGGITVIGGVAGGVLAAAFFCKVKKRDFFLYGRIAFPALAVSQGIGRIGCFLNGDAFGTPTNLPRGIQFPKLGRNPFGLELNGDWASPAWRWAYEHGFIGRDSLKTPRLHPTQLYELLFGIFLALILVLTNRKGASGKTTALTYVLGYCIARGLLEFIHGDRELIVFMGNLPVCATRS